MFLHRFEAIEHDFRSRGAGGVDDEAGGLMIFLLARSALVIEIIRALLRISVLLWAKTVWTQTKKVRTGSKIRFIMMGVNQLMNDSLREAVLEGLVG